MTKSPHMLATERADASEVASSLKAGGVVGPPTSTALDSIVVACRSAAATRPSRVRCVKAASRATPAQHDASGAYSLALSTGYSPFPDKPFAQGGVRFGSYFRTGKTSDPKNPIR